MSGVFGLSSIIGPLAGGYLTDNLSWRWVFYVNVPVGAVVLLALWLTFPSLKREGGRPRIDYIGALAIVAAASMLTLGASRAGTDGWSNPWVIGLLAGGAILMVLVPFYEARIKEAVLPPQMFKSSIFTVSTIISFLLGIGMFATIVYIPLFLQGVVGVSALQSGLLIWPMMAGMMTGSIGGGIILSRSGRYKAQAFVGLSLMAIGVFLMTLLTVEATWVQVSVDMVVFGLGLGTTFPVLNVAAQNAVEKKFISPAVSSMQFIRQIGATLGLAALGSVANQELATKTAEQLPPSKFANIPPQYLAQVKALENPQALFGGAADNILKNIHDPAQRQIFLNLVTMIKQGVKVALAESVHTLFVYALVLIVAAVVVSLFMREIPLAKAHEWGSSEGGNKAPMPEPMV
jgi:predicted MFS family arabinose efflux permease